MRIRYYKTARPELLGAYRDLMAAVYAMRDNAREVCSQFDAAPVIGQCVNRYTYYGMKLNNYIGREDAHLWTKPDKNLGFLSRPRARLSGFAPDVKALKERFTQAHGDMETSVSKHSFHELLGTDWGQSLSMADSQPLSATVIFTSPAPQHCQI